MRRYNNLKHLYYRLKSAGIKGHIKYAQIFRNEETGDKGYNIWMKNGERYKYVLCKGLIKV